MIKKYYPAIDETLYSDKLSNGLQVYYLPKPDFHKTYGIFSTGFGSLDTRFGGKTYPAGIAHFLEHKLFEKEEGDVMLKFGRLGAQTNAFTSFDRTAYLFEGSEHVAENVKLLLDFVQEPYFTAASVAKEQGIIGQEIQMYQDDPDWRLYAGVLANLYPGSPLAEDIAGTPESIGQITPEMLYENYQTFYQPANMQFFLAGNFDLAEISRLVAENQAAKTFPQVAPVEHLALETSPVISEQEIAMEVADSKLALGLRGNNQLPAKELFRYRLALQLFFAMLLGKTSDFYEEAYQKGQIDDSFSYEFECNRQFQVLIISLDTADPKKLSQTLQELLKCYRMKEEFSASQFELAKRRMLAAYFSTLNSLEAVANEFTSPNDGSENSFFDTAEMLQQLTLADVEKFAKDFLKNAEYSQFIIQPKM